MTEKQNYKAELDTCKITAYISPEQGLFLFLEDSMSEKTFRFAILVRDMRAAQKRYFDTRDKANLSRAKELEKKVDDELVVIFGGVQAQGTLL